MISKTKGETRSRYSNTLDVAFANLWQLIASHGLHSRILPQHIRLPGKIFSALFPAFHFTDEADANEWEERQGSGPGECRPLIATIVHNGRADNGSDPGRAFRDNA
jgi:hypothetical protein